MPLINVNKLNIYYEIHGDTNKMPLVLIPGLGQSHSMWIPVLDKLLESNQIILLDNRGAGQSDSPTIDYTTLDMATDINALLTALEIPKANILGASMGGMIAQEFTLHFSEKVNKLILNSTFLKMSIRTQRLLLNTARWFQLGYVEEAFNSILTNVYAEKFLSDPQSVAKTLQAIQNDPYPQTPVAFNGQFNACIKHNTCDRIRDINLPTLLLGGTRDILALEEDMRQLQKLLANAEASFIPDTAHATHAENPNQFVYIVTNFLAKH